MATERFNKYKDRDEDRVYFKMYADIILPKVKGKVLDLGCGEGWLTKEIAKMPSVETVIACDKFSEQPEENKDEKIEYIKSNINDLNFIGQFDTIVSTEFIEHITEEDLNKLLVKITKWLKPDGRFLGSTPNVNQHSGNPYHLREYSVDELKAKFSLFNFTGDYSHPIPFLTVFDVWFRS